MKKIDIADYGYRGSYEGEFTVGRICSQEKGMYTLVSEFGEQQAVILGKLRFSAKCPSDFPTVGDFVLSDCQNGENQAVIHEILPRKSVFIRKTAGENDSQAVGANIDTIFICMSLNNDFNIRRLERYISAAWDSGATPVVLLTKADLWSDPEENRKFFDNMGLSRDEIIPVKADAADLPFEKEFFDAVVSTDSYNYFGRDENYLDAHLLPHVKSGGYIYIAIPGMKKDCHDNLPSELLLSWSPEQLDYTHDVAYWRKICEKCRGAQLIGVTEMESNEEVWADWLKQENEYAVGDRKAMEAGGGKYLNFIKIVLKKY